jgi:DNA invertase Pin-like site-specific DNA recombinase
MPKQTKDSDVAYSYLRFSNPSQGTGDSINRQTELREAWLAKSGVTLDTSLTLEDRGVSGFTGVHRTNPDRHALAAFLELVKQGRIKRGSYLVVESLDRLSREHIRPALTLLLNLIDAGVRVVQLLPVEAVYDEDVEPMQLLMAVMELSRGHSESAVKSERLSAAWKRKREKAANGAVISRACPAWIEVEGEGASARYVLIPERADVVRRVFHLSAAGHGARAVVNALAADNVAPFGSRPWNASYVKLMLRNRAAFGEFTPRTGRGSPAKRKEAGAAIAGYYPAAVTEAEFHAAGKAAESRREKGGRPAKKLANLFAGLIHDARTGGRLHLKQYSRGDGRFATYLAPYEAERGGEHVSFPLDIFERAVLSLLKEIKPREILPNEDGGADRVLALSGKLADVEGRIEKIKAKLIDDGDVSSLVDVLRSLEAKRAAAAEALAEAQREAASPLSRAWGEAKSLLDVLDDADDPQAARVRLRGALRRVVESVWCLFMPGRGTRVAAVQIFFAGGARRDHLVLYKPTKKNSRGGVEGRWWVRGVADVPGPADLDLRKKADARRLEKALGAVDLAGLGG